MTGPHPDDEALSAALDGEDAPAAAHLVGCAACQARRDALDLARQAVSADSPGVAPTGLADRAVAAALAAYAAERADPSGTSSPAGPVREEGSVVPLRAATGQPGSFTSHGSSPSARIRRRVPVWALGAAAALAAILVAVPVLTRDGDNSQKLAQVGKDLAGTEAAPAPGTGPVVDGGDLGDQSDQLALGGVLAGAVSGAPAETSSPAVERSAADSAAPAAAQARPTPGTLMATPGAPTTTASVPACEAAVRADYARGLGPLLYRATLRWQGTPAVLLAYRLADTAGTGPDHRAFVMALDGCRPLVVQGF